MWLQMKSNPTSCAEGASYLCAALEKMSFTIWDLSALEKLQPKSLCPTHSLCTYKDRISDFRFNDKLFHQGTGTYFLIHRTMGQADISGCVQWNLCQESTKLGLYFTELASMLPHCSIFSSIGSIYVTAAF